MSESLLEERYRFVLRMLPASYRATWEEEMVSAFLESAYAADPDDPEAVELGRPSRAEVASIAALALRLRLGGPGAPPRAVALGEAIQRVALIGLFAHCVYALVGVLLDLWIIKRLPGLTIPDGLPVMYPDRWQALWNLTPLLWLPVYLSALYAYRRWACGLGVIALVPVLVAFAVNLVGRDGDAYLASHWYWLVFSALPVLALLSFQRGAPQVSVRSWLVALPVGAAGVFAFELSTMPTGDQAPWYDGAALWCFGLVAANVGYLAWARSRPDARSAPLARALVWLSVAVLGLRLVSMNDYLTFGVPTADRPTVLAIDLGQAAGLLVTALALGLVARTARRDSRNAVG